MTVRHKIFLALFFLTQAVFAFDRGADAFQEGDIIFMQSQSAQAPAVSEATDSEWSHMGILLNKDRSWYVAEAVGPLELTPLKKFIERSKNRSYRVMRNHRYDPKTMKKSLYTAIYKYNKPYDIYFEFSDSRIYCSELVHKVFKDVTGLGVGEIQKVKDLKLNGPYVQKLIEVRLKPIGKELNLEEDIVTPVSIMEDVNLSLIKDSYKP
jgi:hypothetical protein